MLARNYMVIDRRHDHSFRVPRPDLSVRLGTPNTCNECHADRSAQWAADTVAEWYGPSRQQGPHYGDVLAAGRMGRSEALSRLTALARDVEQAAIVRATALALLRGYGTQAAAALVGATRDEDPLVRSTAAGGLDRLPPALRLTPAAPLLRDPIRAVRTEAARVLAAVPRESLSPAQLSTFEEALEEYRSAQIAQADTPAAHLNLAVVLAHQGQPERAEEAYRTAIRLDPGFLPARFNLANLYNQMGRNPDAESVLREGIRRAPEEGSDKGELHYSLGLLLAEEQRLEEADRHLALAAELLPGRARVRYNRALLLQRLGRDAQAEEVLLEARELARSDPNILYALAVFYAQREDWSRALPHAEELTKLAPEAPGPRQLLERIRTAIAAHGGPS
jgi:tetratricopeptide (TPR) repeat protein